MIKRSLTRHLFLSLLSLALLIPFYIAFINAFKTKSDIVNNPLSFPVLRLTLDNIVKAASNPSFNIFKAYGTTALITVVTIVFTILLSAMMSYVIARHNNTTMKVIYFLLLAGLMIPPQVTLIPSVQLLHKLGLMFTSQGLILYNLGVNIPFTVFVYTGFIRTVPLAVEEAAIMEGAGSGTIFWRIIFPLLKPATGSIVTLLFIWVWNDFLSPLLILGSSRGYTVTTGIYQAIGKYTSNWDQVFGLIFLVSFPLLLFYVFMQRYLIAGLTEGAVKG
jgi:raffinose/stachyose/melibiose transport system permease protein